MRLYKTTALLALALSACVPAATKAPLPVAPLDASILAQLMQSEDLRTYDATTFDRIALNANDVIRAQTAMAAGRIGDRAATSLLINMLRDASPRVRSAAAFAIGELGDTSVAAITALNVPIPEAVHALGKIGGPTARAIVETMLHTSKDPAVVKEALLAIWKFPRTPATTEAVLPFVSSPDPEIRWRAVYALTRPLPDPANVTRFIGWIQDRDPLVRSFVVRGLRAANADSANLRAEASTALIAALRDADAHVRVNAVTMLGGYRNPEFSRSVVPLLNDPDFNVRVSAAGTLGLLKGPLAVEALERVIADTTQRVAIRGAAFASFTAIDGKRGIELGQKLRRTEDWQMRMYIARGAAQSKTPESLALAYELAHDDPRVAAPAVASAAVIAGDTLKGARALFIEMLAGSDAVLRSEALGGLERLAEPGDEAIALDAFERALRDSTEDAANAAIGVLAKLGKNNPAILRTFATRFPLSRLTLIEVQRAAIREMKVEGVCCKTEARPDVYTRVVNNVLLPALQGKPLPRVRITTENAGSFDIEMLAADAPITVDNFMTLAARGYFNGNRWHRVVPNFVLQDGDPTGTGSGGPGYAIRDEINPVRYLRAIVGMALSGPDTGGSQFFVTHSPQPHLDGGYTVFGRVISGMENADRVVQDDRITRIEIIK
ncbi:MAG TPA: HEAT repeat domain-containing protein [Longimicrobiales bacterium]|nr:HEAT repeat domain-containing protein [Longimicrobiales bacterium]